MSMPPNSEQRPTGEGSSLSRPTIVPMPELTAPPVPSPSSAKPRRRVPRTPSVLAGLMIFVGLLLLTDAGITLVWQEPISALYAQLKQESLGGDLRALERAGPTPEAQHTLSRLHEERLR